jgi:hypothetical protein
VVGKGREGQEDNSQRVIKASSVIFFLDNNLVRLITSNRGSNIVYLYNITEAKEQTMLLSDFKKHRKRAYTLSNTARLLNRSNMQLYRYIDRGLVKPPTGILPGGKRMFTKKSYYSEDDVFEIRRVMGSLHRGRPRKDGKITNNHVLTEQELRGKMGDALMLYTKTKDGRFIPVWQEDTY